MFEAVSNYTVRNVRSWNCSKSPGSYMVPKMLAIAVFTNINKYFLNASKITFRECQQVEFTTNVGNYNFSKLWQLLFKNVSNYNFRKCKQL